MIGCYKIPMNTPRTLAELVNLLQQIAPGSSIVLGHYESEGCIMINTTLQLASDGQTIVNTDPDSDVTVFRY